LNNNKNKKRINKMARVKRIFPELPDVTPVAGTKILVTDADNFAFGYADVSTLQVTLDGTGLASDAALSAVSASFASVSRVYNISGSFANDGAAAAANIPVGGLYHTSGTVKVRLS
jgi:hypothetical protein